MKKRRLTTSEIGGWRTWFGTNERGRRGKRTGGRGRSRGLQKEARRLLQEHHAVDGHHHQAVPADRTRDAVSLRRPLRHNHHGHGTRRREEHAGADASAQREGTSAFGSSVEAKPAGNVEVVGTSLRAANDA